MNKVSRLSILSTEGDTWDVSDAHRQVAYEDIISNGGHWISFVVDTGVHVLLPREKLRCIEIEFGEQHETVAKR